MGVSGSGKTTVAEGIARATGMVFAEADEFHSEANIAKMRAGRPLKDADRWRWLEALSEWMRRGAVATHPPSLPARRCGAPTAMSYAAVSTPSTSFTLTGPAELIRTRMATREGHYMPAALLDYQLATLEPLEPDESGIVLDSTRPVTGLVADILTRLEGGKATPRVGIRLEFAVRTSEVIDAVGRHAKRTASQCRRVLTRSHCPP
jgi:gluconokinase